MKLALSAPSGNGLTPFPSLSGDGPIEAYQRRIRERGSEAHFHPFRGMAPLKRVLCMFPALSSTSFPSLSGDGPIEARPQYRRYNPYHGFPSLSGDGPIEAIISQWMNCTISKFPSLSGDGPIEAKEEQECERHLSSFPSLSGDGPIEAGKASPITDKKSKFPSLSGDGPIEARDCTGCSVLMFRSLALRFEVRVSFLFGVYIRHSHLTIQSFQGNNFFMKKLIHRIKSILITLILISFPTTLYAQNKTALVIGNAAYPTALTTPVNDARDMTQTLEFLGYSVTTLTDATRRQTVTAIRDFTNSLNNGSMGIFYYSGHAARDGGQNYLIPVDGDIQNRSDLEFNAIPLDALSGRLNGKGKTAVILDAARNNAFPGSETGASGLAQLNRQPEESFFIYSAAPGTTVGESLGRNSYLTASLLKYINTPGLEIEDMMKLVSSDASRNGQSASPWYNSSFTTKYYISGSDGDPGAISSLPTTVNNDTGSRVSDAMLNALIGEDVIIRMDDGIVAEGTLKYLTQEVIVMISDSGEIFEINKNKIMQINLRQSKRDANIAATDGNRTNDKYQEYEYKKKTTGWPFLLNFFVGFGIGSYVQGDLKGGTVGLIGDLMGVTFMFFHVAFNDYSNDPYLYENTYQDYTSLILGTAILSCSRIFQWIAPFVHANNYNKDLRKKLGITKSQYSLSINPIFVPARDGEGIDPGIGVQLTY